MEVLYIFWMETSRTAPGRRISMEVFVAAAQTLCGRAREQRSPKRYPGNLQKTHNYSRNPDLSCLSLKKIVLENNEPCMEELSLSNKRLSVSRDNVER